jgi:hypothetical protein
MDLDATLARAAADGFLTTLIRPELAGMTDFYRVDNSQTDGLTAELQEISDYQLSEGKWAAEDTYQVTATLQPGSWQVDLYVQENNGRWQVAGFELLSQPQGAVYGSTTAIASSGVVPVEGNGSGKIVFQTRSGGDIYVINADGTGLQRVTTGLDPQLSPDGTQIAFTRWDPRYELFTINIDGSNEQAWTHGWRQMKSPTWSADGSKLIFSYQDGGRLEGDNIRVDLEDVARDGDEVRIPADAVALEREGKYLKYTLPPDAYWHLKQIDLNTGEFLDLGTENYTYGPSGHPADANLLAYKGERGLALHNIVTNLSQPITSDFRDHTPVYSPDGSKIAVSYWQDGHWEVHTLNANGDNRQRLTSTPFSVLVENTELVSENVAGAERFVAPENPHWNNAAPVWSPDGTQIAFLTDRTGQWEIWIMAADGSNQRPMFSNGAVDDLTFNYAGVDERMLSWH